MALLPYVPPLRVARASSRSLFRKNVTSCIVTQAVSKGAMETVTEEFSGERPIDLMCGSICEGYTIVCKAPSRMKRSEDQATRNVLKTLQLPCSHEP